LGRDVVVRGIVDNGYDGVGLGLSGSTHAD
jgi:hypothetical protein